MSFILYAYLQFLQHKYIYQNEKKWENLTTKITLPARQQQQRALLLSSSRNISHFPDYNDFYGSSENKKMREEGTKRQAIRISKPLSGGARGCFVSGRLYWGYLGWGGGTEGAFFQSPLHLHGFLHRDLRTTKIKDTGALIMKQSSEQQYILLPETSGKIQTRVKMQIK